MPARMPTAVAAAALAVAGCGSGGAGGGGDSPSDVRQCLAGKRYVAAVKPASAVLGTTGEVDVQLHDNRAALYFFTSEDVAQRQAIDLGTALSGAGTGGHTVRYGTVVIGYARDPSHADRSAVDGCVR